MSPADSQQAVDEIIERINQLDETTAANFAKNITGQYLRMAHYQLDMLPEALTMALNFTGVIVVLVSGADDAGVLMRSAVRQDQPDSQRVIDTVRRLCGMLESTTPKIVEQQMATESGESQGD